MRRRRLPHLDIPGHPQFITFRLSGSLPADRRFPERDLTSGEAFVAMDRLLDAARSGPTFLRQAVVAELVAASIRYGSEARQYDLHAWVIMPNHVHLLITPHVEMSRLLCSLKSVTAKRANLQLHRTGEPFWQDESYDHLVRNNDECRRIERYIETNPVRACLADTPEEYRWSSAFKAGRGPAAA